ncbi:PhzF family phenazine biosynthesis protein [Dyella nitratireducens]|uniref:Phenazine biosynthesis protein n=1 Tax=Dyella nitratireducens TaxID=1849580 RepID=A0ABQ1G0M6_9GAMM|nr:PhzF family phenazine biosynthesis protein [Dyella nitratireducens]GGA34336.1 phenazine biosynthesis protein [Dyella nitratireducens]GLQ40851.1 phenazine biosynthesis protein [Dyella nitratireducens]
MQIDVFSRQPMKGNPLAVVIDSDGLDDAAMRAFARWTNLSETAFLLPPTAPEADYRVRIFTPMQELPFAGHPSVGSAYAAIESGLIAGGKTKLIQQCAAGLLPVDIEHPGVARTIHVQAPVAQLRSISTEVRHAIAEAVHVAPDHSHLSLVDNGPRWWVCDLHEASRVRALKPDLSIIKRLSEEQGNLGIVVFGKEYDGPARMAVRAFCPSDGIPEDPVTGSANAAIMAFLLARKDAHYGESYVASQGREIGRDGYVTIRHAANGAITIGGQCVTVIEGELDL